ARGGPEGPERYWDGCGGTGAAGQPAEPGVDPGTGPWEAATCTVEAPPGRGPAGAAEGALAELDAYSSTYSCSDSIMISYMISSVMDRRTNRSTGRSVYRSIHNGIPNRTSTLARRGMARPWGMAS